MLPATDTFTGTNSDPLSGNWTTTNGAWIIFSNRAFSNTADSLVKWTADAFDNDQYAQVTVHAIGLGGSNYGPAVRIGTVTGYSVTISADGTELTLKRAIDVTIGSYVTIQTISGLSIANGDTIKLQVTGTTLRVYQNDVQRGTDSTDANISSGSAGMLSIATGDQAMDNFQADDVTGGEGGAGEAFEVSVPKFPRAMARMRK
jgi:hypothetical protein